MTQDRRDQQLVEAAIAAGSGGRHKAVLDAPAKLDADELEEPTPDESEALSGDTIGIDDSVRPRGTRDGPRRDLGRGRS